MSPKVLVTDPIHEEGLRILQAHAEVDTRPGLSPKQLLEVIGDYDALVVRSETKVNAAVIEAGKRLQVIGRAGTGVDNIDVEAATRRGIVVVNAPTANTISATEHTLALMLALCRHIPQAHSLLREGVWRRADFMGVELRGKTLGVVGLGNVGSALARRAVGLEMQVIAYDPYISEEYAKRFQVKLVSLEEILRTADFISLHLPLNESTQGLIGERELRLVKPTVRIINAARGGLVDEVALFRALEEGRVAGAAMDVFTVEPAKDNILFKSDKVIVTPHIAASTAEAQASVSVDTAEQVVAVLQGKPARYAVNAPFIPADLFPVLGPFVPLGMALGRLASQLVEEHMSALHLKYEGEIGTYDPSALRAAVLGGLLERVSLERVNLVNANMLAQKRGLRIIEEKGGSAEPYPSLLTAQAITSTGQTLVAGTVIRGEPHIVRVNQFWLDIVPTGGYFLFCDHRDRPGLIGAVGTITGKMDINIHSMQLLRLQPRGQALMVLGLDEPLAEEQRRQVLAIPDIHTARLVKL